MPTYHQGGLAALRDTRRGATLCPDCQDQVSPRDVKPELYGYGKMSTAHLYAVPVLAAFDAIRNCSHCRRNTSEYNCKAWREAREGVTVSRLYRWPDLSDDPMCERAWQREFTTLEALFCEQGFPFVLFLLRRSYTTAGTMQEPLMQAPPERQYVTFAIFA